MVFFGTIIILIGIVIVAGVAVVDTGIVDSHGEECYGMKWETGATARSIRDSRSL